MHTEHDCLQKRHVFYIPTYNGFGLNLNLFCFVILIKVRKEASKIKMDYFRVEFCYCNLAWGKNPLIPNQGDGSFCHFQNQFCSQCN